MAKDTCTWELGTFHEVPLVLNSYLIEYLCLFWMPN